MGNERNRTRNEASPSWRSRSLSWGGHGGKGRRHMRNDEKGSAVIPDGPVPTYAVPVAAVSIDVGNGLLSAASL
jgi:hypothetical protein